MEPSQNAPDSSVVSSAPENPALSRLRHLLASVRAVMDARYRDVSDEFRETPAQREARIMEDESAWTLAR